MHGERIYSNQSITQLIARIEQLPTTKSARTRLFTFICSPPVERRGMMNDLIRRKKELLQQIILLRLGTIICLACQCVSPFSVSPPEDVKNLDEVLNQSNHYKPQELSYPQPEIILQCLSFTSLL